jgi:Rrf2 family iron-sulfur cluster assembly transcriptional regulator
MSLIFSRSCEYALQACLYLAHQGDEFVLLRDVSDHLDIPHHFLSKVLQTLTRNKIVVSSKGLNGGFALARSAKKIALIDIVRAVDGEQFLEQCILGFPGCRDKSPCPMHFEWKRAREIISTTLHKKSLARLSRELHSQLNLIAHLEQQK